MTIPQRFPVEGPWRVGRKLGRTLYVGDAVVGMVDTPGLAGAIVAAMNGETCGKVRSDGASCDKPKDHPGFCRPDYDHAAHRELESEVRAVLDAAWPEWTADRADLTLVLAPVVVRLIESVVEARKAAHREQQPVAGVEVGTVVSLDLDGVRNGHVPWPGAEDDGTCSCCGMPHPCVTRRLADQLEDARAEVERLTCACGTGHYCEAEVHAFVARAETAEAQVAAAWDEGHAAGVEYGCHGQRTGEWLPDPVNPHRAALDDAVPPPAAPTFCARTPNPGLSCALAPGHDGMHQSAGHWWGGPRRAAESGWQGMAPAAPGDERTVVAAQ